MEIRDKLKSRTGWSTPNSWEEGHGEEENRIRTNALLSTMLYHGFQFKKVVFAYVHT